MANSRIFWDDSVFPYQHVSYAPVPPAPAAVTEENVEGGLNTAASGGSVANAASAGAAGGDDDGDGDVGQIRSQLTVGPVSLDLIDVAQAAEKLPLEIRVRVIKPLSLVTKISLAIESPLFKEAVACHEAWTALNSVMVTQTPPHEIFKPNDEYMVVEEDSEHGNRHVSTHDNVRATWHELSKYPLRDLRDIVFQPYDINLLPAHFRTRNMQWNSVTDLHLEHCSVVGDFTRRTVMFLEQHPNLTSLHLSLNGITPDGLVALWQAVKPPSSWPQLRHFYINQSTKHGVARPRPVPAKDDDLFDALKDHVIHTLDLSRLNVSSEVYGKVLQKQQQHLRVLTVGVFVDVTDIFNVCPNAAFSNLTTVTICDARYGDIHLQMRTLLRRCGQMTSLTVCKPDSFEFHIYDAIAFFFNPQVVRSTAKLVCNFTFGIPARMLVALNCVKSYVSLNSPPLDIAVVDDVTDEDEDDLLVKEHSSRSPELSGVGGGVGPKSVRSPADADDDDGDDTVADDQHATTADHEAREAMMLQKLKEKAQHHQLEISDPDDDREEDDDRKEDEDVIAPTPKKPPPPKDKKSTVKKGKERDTVEDSEEMEKGETDIKVEKVRYRRIKVEPKQGAFKEGKPAIEAEKSHLKSAEKLQEELSFRRIKGKETKTPEIVEKTIKEPRFRRIKAASEPKQPKEEAKSEKRKSTRTRMKRDVEEIEASKKQEKPKATQERVVVNFKRVKGTAAETTKPVDKPSTKSKRDKETTAKTEEKAKPRKRPMTVIRTKKPEKVKSPAVDTCERGVDCDTKDEKTDEDGDRVEVNGDTDETNDSTKLEPEEEVTPAPAHHSHFEAKDEPIVIKYTRIKGKKAEPKLKRRNEEDDEEEEPEPIIPATVSPEVAEMRAEKTKVPIHSLFFEKVKYKKFAITNRADNRIREQLDEADRLLDQVELNPQPAMKAFNEILYLTPNSPRAHYGKARAFDKLSQQSQSNDLLEKAIAEYEKVMDAVSVPDALFRLAGERLADRAKFRGLMRHAMRAQRRLIDMFPEDADLQNSLGVTFLMMNRPSDAKKIFRDVLDVDPFNGFALAHYGFILKLYDHEIEEGVKLMRKGIKSNAPGTWDARFFFHAGDGLQRLGHTAEAYKIYEEGAEKGLFLSKYQRSLYNVKSLKSKPFWTMEETGYNKYLKMIEKQWMTIAEEGLALLDKEKGIFRIEDEQLTKRGDWRQFTLYQRGIRNSGNCARAPKTCALVEKFPAAIGCTRGQIKFSVMEGGTHVWPHCGPTNCRIRAHLGLVVPPEPRIRVGNETRSWKQGHWLIFDDSFEHEVWHDGLKSRLVLILDFWHPDLSEKLRRDLAPI